MLNLTIFGTASGNKTAKVYCFNTHLFH